MVKAQVVNQSVNTVVKSIPLLIFPPGHKSILKPYPFHIIHIIIIKSSVPGRYKHVSNGIEEEIKLLPVYLKRLKFLSSLLVGVQEQ